MRDYELVCVIQPDLDETALDGVIERVKGWITEAEGKVEKVDQWGKRRLAYMIQKQREGLYVLFTISLPARATSELERNLRFLEPVLRYMITAV